MFIANARVTRNFKFEERMSLECLRNSTTLPIGRTSEVSSAGNQYAPSTYQKPVGYLGGGGSVSSIPSSFQVQFGGRFNF